MKNSAFDLIIIGGGAGAFAAAIRANELGAKTAMINAGLPLGGTCVNVGCVPSKRLLYAGEILHHAKHHGVAGIELDIKFVDYRIIIRDELALVEKLRQDKYEKVLKNLEHVSLFEGKGSFVSDSTVEVNGNRLNAMKFIIATGSTANVPPIEDIREVGFVTHIEALQRTVQPLELIVIGAGPVGLEFAQMFARFGTKVTILERAASILPQVEKRLTDRLADLLHQEGVTIIKRADVSRAFRDGDRKAVVYTSAGKEHIVRGDEILVAAEKTANTQSLNLEIVGVTINERKSIVVNDILQTTNNNVYAVGDVTNAPARYEPSAGREGTIAAENALSGSALSIDYNTVPFTVFTDPQIAGVGTSESRQMKELGACNCRTISFDMVPKAIIMNRTEGLIHMAVDITSPTIVGMQILAPNAGDLIATGMMIVKNRNTLDDVVTSMPMFPTLSEAIKIAALSFTKDINNLSCCV